MEDEHWMNAAILEAKDALHDGEWPFGAVLVMNGVLIAHNRRRETKEKNVLAHAELNVLGDACQRLQTTDLSACVLYTTNEPCLMCSAAIFQAKIRRVVIAASRADLAHLIRARKLHIEDAAADSGFPIEIVRGVLRNEVLALFAGIKK
jgi:guanine deaminase